MSPSPQPYEPTTIAKIFELLDNKLVTLNLEQVAQNSKYATLETLMQQGEWQQADRETYRLMITAVGKEEGQGFSTEDLQNFPCEDLQAIDRLWVDYSQGKWGFSVQKRIWQECGSPTESNDDWKKFGDRVAWLRRRGRYPDAFTFDPSTSVPGHLPVGVFWGFWVLWVGVGVLFSRKDL